MTPAKQPLRPTIHFARHRFTQHKAESWLRRCISLLLVLAWLPSVALAAPRVALLVGNQSYKQGALSFPRQDVSTIRAALLDVGFQAADVVVLHDADQKTLKRALSAFGARARGAEVAFLYYSGHATQARGQNWLIPVGAEIQTEADYDLEAVSAQAALAQLQEAAPALSIVVLDACRDNPVAVTKSGTKGLGRMDAGASTVLAFATAPNQTAADNGLYAQVLAAQLRTPGQEVLDIFRNTGAEVRRRSNNQQAPRMSEVDLPRRFYLTSAPAEPPVKREQALWTTALSENTEAAYTAYLRAYPQGQFAVAASNALAALKPQPPRPEPALRPGQVVKDCADCPELVLLPPGRFLMGSPGNEAGRGDNEGPQHEVRIGYGLAVGRKELSRGEFARFVHASGYRTEAEQNAGGKQGCMVLEGDKWEYRAGRSWRNPGFEQTDEHPVVCVSWNDAQAYLKWLNGQAPGKGYRLLSEAEWEYAARAGSSSRYPWGDDSEYRAQCGYGNGADGKAKAQIPGAGGGTVVNCDDGYAYTAPGGRFRANAFGLYDMHGNVWEWVQDTYQDSYQGAPEDGSAREGGSGETRGLRGGSWNISPQNLRSAIRNRKSPDFRSFGFGVRIARTY